LWQSYEIWIFLWKLINIEPLTNTINMILWMKKIIGEKFSFSRRENVNNLTIWNIYCYGNLCSHTILLLVGTFLLHKQWICTHTCIPSVRNIHHGKKLHSNEGQQWIRNCKNLYRTFGLVNQDDSPDRINFYQTKRKSKFFKYYMWHRQGQRWLLCWFYGWRR
jgi:hypothetical protein